MKYLFALILLSSCYTAKKAEKQLDKAIAEYPAMAAEKTRDRFPCITTAETVRTDTVYELIDVECPPSDFKTVYSLKTDTLYKDRVTVLKGGKQTVYVPGKTTTVTKVIEDSAKIFIAEDKVKSLQTEVSELEDKNEGKRSLIWWLIILLLLSIGGNYLQAKRIIW